MIFVVTNKEGSMRIDAESFKEKADLMLRSGADPRLSTGYSLDADGQVNSAIWPGKVQQIKRVGKEELISGAFRPSKE